jgi:hypothetical protein
MAAPALLERVRETIKQDMAGVSKLDASCALVFMLALPGIVWAIVARWPDLMAYIATL